MSIFPLLLAALIAAGGVVYLTSYAPIIAYTGKRVWSPRLLICKLLAPADIILTITLVVMPMVAGAPGISVFVFGALTAAALSAGVVFTRKVMRPRWQAEYEEKRRESK